MSSEQHKDITYDIEFDFIRMMKRSKKDAPAPQPKEVNPVVQVACSIVMGLLFGISLEKGRVFEPRLIRQQMVFEKFVMLKMFCAAAGYSMLVFSLLTIIPSVHLKIAKAYTNFAQPLAYKTVAASAVGAAILGAGMTLSGACPGMLLAQIGAGVPNSGYTIAGGLTGVLLYALIHPWLPTFINRESPEPAKRLDEYVDYPYFAIALPLAAAIGAFVYILEGLVPWDTEVTQSGSDLMSYRSWPAYHAGTIIGLLQLPAVLALHDTLGGSSAYATVLAQLQRLTQCSALAYLDRFKSGMLNWWQVFFVLSAVGGSYLSSQASGTHGTVEGVAPEFAFGGGLLLLLGSRLGQGCTSGHGLSGMALLVTHSLVAVPAMFGGAIATACLMKFGLGMTL